MTSFDAETDVKPIIVINVKGKAPLWPDLSATQSQRKGCKVLATLYFMATAFIGADGQSSPSRPHLRPNKRIEEEESS